MKKIIGVYLFVLFIMQANGQNNYAILPQPTKLTKAVGQFTFKKNTAIIYE